MEYVGCRNGLQSKKCGEFSSSPRKGNCTCKLWKIFVKIAEIDSEGPGGKH